MDNGSPEVTRGFSVWLEPESLHYHAGGVVRVRALWGRMMQREGQADTRGWTCLGLDPGGALLDADIALGEGNYHNAAFFAGGEGLYNLVLENDAGVYPAAGGQVEGSPGEAVGTRYIQRARIPVPVGHHVHGPLEIEARQGLEVFCGEFREFSPGDCVVIRTFFDGKPLEDAEIKATYHLYTGEEYPWSGRTGENGEVSFTFSAKGHWMFTCTHTEAGGGGKTVHTSTFVMAGVR